MENIFGYISNQTVPYEFSFVIGVIIYAAPMVTRSNYVSYFLEIRVTSAKFLPNRTIIFSFHFLFISVIYAAFLTKIRRITFS